MSAMAIPAALTAPSPTPATAPANTDVPDGFSALLSELSRPGATGAPPAAPDKSKRHAADGEPLAPDASLQTALQSLEVTLNGMSVLTPASTAVAAPSPAGAALTAAVVDASGKTSLKALLQGDPALGLREFQMKTFLAAAGATPTKAGGDTLGAGAAWSPLGAPKADAPQAVALATSVRASGAGAAIAAVGSSRASSASPAPRQASAPRAASEPPAPGMSMATDAGREDGDAVAPVASSTAGGGAKQDGAAPSLAADVAALATGSTAPSVVVVPLANLPAFIADQASAMAPAAAPSAAGAAAAPQAAQAVKELRIALAPAELGEMTLKLRLAGGKLSVTISIANPQTLTAIEGDRALIAARLGGGEQALHDLVIQSQAPANPENASSHGFSSDNGGEPSRADRGRSSEPDRRQDAPPGGAARAGDAFDDLVV